MKKVFAFLSTMLLTIAFVGIFAVKTPAAAAGKFTEDPTLEKDEIPVYIMSSIYTTFPNYYDNDAKEDDKWAGTSRMYPWNETRLRVAQFDADGNPTGKYYAVYFSGATTAVDKDGNMVVGAGNNILAWNVDENGNVVSEKYAGGKKASSGQASDPSLSHMRSNISGQDLEFIPVAQGVMSNSDEAKNFYNRSFVVNAEGQIIRGIALDDVYTAAAGSYKFAPEYCYSGGEVVKIEEGVVCDKVQVEAKGEDGEPLKDENGNIIYVDGEEDDKIYSRFVWEYFTEEPENVNEVAYLSEGWNPDLWDYCYPSGDGYMAIAFVGSADGTHNVKGDQLSAYVDYLMGTGLDEATANAQAQNHQRACVASIRIPAGGYTFDYGFLDKGTSNDTFFNETVINGYLYGRTMLNKVERGGNKTDELIGMAEQRTYDFSVTGLTFTEKVVDGASYRLLNGENTVEVMMGSKFNATQFINYNGVMRYWAEVDNLMSYSSSADSLEFYVTTAKNGGNASTVVAPPQGYTSLEEIKADLLADLTAFKGTEPRFDTKDTFHADMGWGGFVATSSDNAKKTEWDCYGTDTEPYLTSFMNCIRKDVLADENLTDEQKYTYENSYRAKWGWLIEQIYQTMLEFPGGDTYAATSDHFKNASASFNSGSPSTIHYGIWMFLTGTSHSYLGFNFAPAEGSDVPNSALWIDSATSKEKWDAYTLDATMAAPDDNWVVTYTVYNATTKNEESITVKYVVVDSYTPVLSVNTNALVYTPKMVGDLIEIKPIDPLSIVTAYSGQYNGVDMLGNDISQRIDFETELNWDAPKEGKYPVVATVWNNAHTKKAVAKFTVIVNDITAPIVTTRDVVVQQGDLFDCRDGIVIAYDVVDGNLKQSAGQWWVEESDMVDTVAIFESDQNRGKDQTVKVTVTVSDTSANSTTVSYMVTIVAEKVLVDDLAGSFGDVTDAIAELSDIVNDIYDRQETQNDALEAIQKAIEELSTSVSDNALNSNTSISDLEKSIEDVTAKVSAVQTSVDGVNAKLDESGCNSGSLLVLQIAGAATLLALVLRKKH